MRHLLVIGAVAAGVLAGGQARADSWCGGVNDSCQCGADNPYPCCDNGNGKSSNCTWGAWHHACCDWGVGLPGWSHAKYWAGNAAAHPDYDVLSYPVGGSIGCRASGYYGHVAYVTWVDGGTVGVNEMSCCEGSSCWPSCSWCINGFQDTSYSAGYFDGGYIIKQGAVNKCGDGNCAGGENCGSCPQDCGNCCGNGACDNGESCGSCPQDCGNCCGNGGCDNGESCQSCPQDCGNCCGNGACDYGEDCASCEKDCGICNEVPEGKLEVVSCEQIAGWALDKDVGGAIGVRLLKNGGLLQEMAADQQHEVHPGHGFRYLVGHDLKDGGTYTIEAIALDDKGLADKAIEGSGRQLLCRNGSEEKGIWTVEYVDSAGVEIGPVANGDDPWTVLQLLHAPGLPYNNSGTTTARTDFVLGTFEKLTATGCGGFGSGLYSAGLWVDGQAVAALGEQVAECGEMEWAVPGTQVAVAFASVGMPADPEGRELLLKGLSAWSKGWRLGYSFDAAGLVVGAGAADGVQFGMRAGKESCVGFAAAVREVSGAFEGVEAKLPAGKGDPVKLVFLNGDGAEVGAAEGCAGGSCQVSLGGKRLRLEARCEGGVAVPGGWTLPVEKVRVWRGLAVDDPPWVATGTKVWALSAGIPEVTRPGLAFRLGTEESDFVPFGMVSAETEFPDPEAEEVRGVLSYSLAGGCLKAAVTMDGQPVTSLEGGAETVPFVVKSAGSRLGLALVAGDECTGGEAGAVQVTDVSYERQGWWTTATPRVAGIRDGRSEGCGLTFDNLRWWGMSERKAYGGLVVERFLAEEHTGIRYSFRHTFEGPYFGFRLVLDGKAAKQHELHQPGEETVGLTGEGFSRVGFQFTVLESDVYPYRWGLEAGGIEVQSADGEWIAICEAEEGVPGLSGVVDPEDIGEIGTEPPAEGGKDKSGCGVEDAGGWGWWLLIAAGLAVGGWWRRRGERRTNN